MKKKQKNKPARGRKKKTDVQLAGLEGQVKQVKQTCYKALTKADEIVPGKITASAGSENNTLTTYNEQGAKTEEFVFVPKGTSSLSLYNEQGLETEKRNYWRRNLNSRILHKYDEQGNLLETINLDEYENLSRKTLYKYDEQGRQLQYTHSDADGNITSKSIHKYNADGKYLELNSYDAKGLKIQHLYRYNDAGEVLEWNRYNKKGLDQKVIYRYNKQGNKVEELTHDAEGLTGKIIFKYDKKGNNIEKHTYDAEELTGKTIKQFDDKGNSVEYITYNADGSFSERVAFKHNQHGDVIERKGYNEEGNLLTTETFDWEYDEDGKKIIPPYVDPDLPILKSEPCAHDKHGNWTEKTLLDQNNVTVNICTREITYFAEKSGEQPLTPFITPREEDLPTEPLPGLSAEQTRWLAETGTPDNFSLQRYYSLKNDEPPSVLTFSSSNIEALVLLKQLTEKMNARLIHTCKRQYGGHYETMQRYTLSFPHSGYLLHAKQIQRLNTKEYKVPDFILDDEDDYSSSFYTSSLELLHPSPASGKRDHQFEKDLDQLIARHIIYQRPEKPTIYMIETDKDGWQLKSHAVNDDFEIEDLDTNYGYGFSKFHDELMDRFEDDTKGLVLFHGEPGTGKTYYIRHLLRQMASNSKVVIYMPPNMVDHLVEPGFITFLSHKLTRWADDGYFCVLLIEDAEPLLAKRQEGVRIQGVTNLLNMSDGLLNDMLNLQIICTFNVNLKKLDSALLRPGRLIARKEFRKLSELDANVLAQRLGIKHHFKKSATLGEIYAMRKNKNTLIHDVEPDKDASTTADEL